MAQKPKKIPIRHCLGCGEGKTKQEMVRVVKNKAGEIFLDNTGKAPGRGAYVCKQSTCLAKAQKKKSLERAFGVGIAKEVYEQLQEAMAHE